MRLLIGPFLKLFSSSLLLLLTVYCLEGRNDEGEEEAEPGHFQFPADPLATQAGTPDAQNMPPAHTGSGPNAQGPVTCDTLEVAGSNPTLCRLEAC